LPQFAGCVAVTPLTWLMLLWIFRHPLFHELVAVVRTKFPSRVPAQTTAP
jgi:hypothetical protein